MNTALFRAIGGAAALAFAAPALHAGISRDYKETIDMSGISKVVVEISAGHIEVRGVDGPKLELDVEQVFQTSSNQEADEMEKRIERTIEKRDGSLYVKFRYNKRSSSGLFDRLFGDEHGISFNTEIAAPQNVEVVLKTSGGHIAVSKMSNTVEASTSGGHMEFADLAGSLEARTSGGHISARNVTAQDIRLNTSGGHIELTDISGNVVAKTSGGHVEIRNLAGTLDAHTSGGNVFASFDGGLSGDSSLSTSGGSVKARLPSSQGFHVAAETSGGRVNLQHSGTNNGSFKKNKIDADVNGGGPRLNLRSSGGSIEISDT